MAWHKPFLSNGNRLRYPKLNNNSAHNQWQHVLWSGESKLKFLLQIVINMYGAGQERSTTVSVYGHLENTEPLSRCEAAFQPVELKILLKLIKLRTQKVQRDFESPRNTFWKASDWQRLHSLAWSWPQTHCWCRTSNKWIWRVWSFPNERCSEFVLDIRNAPVKIWKLSQYTRIAKVKNGMDINYTP